MARRTPLADPRVTEALMTRPQGIGGVSNAVRIALATTASYVVSNAVGPHGATWFAPITTLLVVQASPFATLGMSIQRVIGTGVGVGVATVWVNAVGVHVWSFLVAILVALLAARLLPISLGAQLQIPVAVVFVLALGPSNETRDFWRVIDVFIGGAIGVAAVWLWPPKVSLEPYHEERDAYVGAQVSVLRAIATELGERHARGRWQQHDFIAASRALREHAGRTRAAYELIADAVRFNVRSRGRADAVRDLSRDMRWLSSITIQIRALAGAVDRLYDRADVAPTLPVDALRTLLGEVATLLETAGTLGAAEARPEGERVREDLRTVLTEMTQGHGAVAEVLDSVSLLGRVDQLVQSVVRGPFPSTTEEAENADEEDEGADEPAAR